MTDKELVGACSPSEPQAQNPLDETYWGRFFLITIWVWWWKNMSF